MKKYKVLCNVDEVISFDEPITIGCVILYYKLGKLIAETSVYAESLPKAEKVGVSRIGKAINVLSTELRCKVNYSLQTIKAIADGKVKNYSNNDLVVELTIRVPFNPKMYSKIKRNNELADEDKKS